MSAWGLEGHDAGAVARRLFEVEPPTGAEPALAITSDSRDGFYLWWLFARGAPAAALARLMESDPSS